MSVDQVTLARLQREVAQLHESVKQLQFIYNNLNVMKGQLTDEQFQDLRKVLSQQFMGPALYGGGGYADFLRTVPAERAQAIAQQYETANNALDQQDAHARTVREAQKHVDYMRGQQSELLQQISALATVHVTSVQKADSVYRAAYEIFTRITAQQESSDAEYIPMAHVIAVKSQEDSGADDISVAHTVTFDDGAQVASAEDEGQFSPHDSRAVPQGQSILLPPRWQDGMTKSLRERPVSCLEEYCHAIQMIEAYKSGRAFNGGYGAYITPSLQPDRIMQWWQNERPRLRKYSEMLESMNRTLYLAINGQPIDLQDNLESFVIRAFNDMVQYIRQFLEGAKGRDSPILQVALLLQGLNTAQCIISGTVTPEIRCNAPATVNLSALQNSIAQRYKHAVDSMNEGLHCQDLSRVGEMVRDMAVDCSDTIQTSMCSRRTMIPIISTARNAR